MGVYVYCMVGNIQKLWKCVGFFDIHHNGGREESLRNVAIQKWPTWCACVCSVSATTFTQISQYVSEKNTRAYVRWDSKYVSLEGDNGLSTPYLIGIGCMCVREMNWVFWWKGMQQRTIFFLPILPHCWQISLHTSYLGVGIWRV